MPWHDCRNLATPTAYRLPAPSDIDADDDAALVARHLDTDASGVALQLQVDTARAARQARHVHPVDEVRQARRMERDYAIDRVDVQSETGLQQAARRRR